VTAVGTILDFREVSTPAGELDVIADLEVSHPALPTRQFRFRRQSVRRDRRRCHR
jgi:hypothetical protein